MSGVGFANAKGKLLLFINIKRKKHTVEVRVIVASNIWECYDVERMPHVVLRCILEAIVLPRSVCFHGAFLTP